MVKYCLFVFSLTLLLPGCSNIPTPAQRLNSANLQASKLGLERKSIAAGTFSLQSYLPVAPTSAELLTVYIEGDGLAWISHNKPSNNPTPIHPTGLLLAQEHPNRTVAYLARPCQYLIEETDFCSQALWTYSRFSNEVVQSSSIAITQIKDRFNAKHLLLVGYSGGGAIAALVAARREDVVGLVTVAGNLDHATWTNQLHLSPLYDSLNPIGFAEQLAAIPQWHYVAGQDSVIPRSVIKSYADQFLGVGNINVILKEAYTHGCCWVDGWTTEITEILKHIQISGKVTVGDMN